MTHNAPHTSFNVLIASPYCDGSLARSTHTWIAPHLSVLVNDLLAFSKVAASNGFPLKTTSISPPIVCRTVLIASHHAATAVPISAPCIATFATSISPPTAFPSAGCFLHAAWVSWSNAPPSPQSPFSVIAVRGSTGLSNGGVVHTVLSISFISTTENEPTNARVVP